LRYWIITVSEENWYIIKSSNVYGAPESQKFKPIHELIKLGDIVIFYVEKKNSKDLGGKFVGALKVVSDWFREDRPGAYLVGAPAYLRRPILEEDAKLIIESLR